MATTRTGTVIRRGSPSELRAHRAENDRWDTSETGRTRLDPSTPAPGPADRDDGCVGLLIADRCRPLIREFQSYTRDDVGTAGADDHCLDALRYAVMGTTT